MNSNNFEKNRGIKSNMVFSKKNIPEDKIQVSVVIPTYRRFLLLEQAINSILIQKGIDKEYCAIIIVDNDPIDSKERYEFIKLLSSLETINIYYYVNEVNLGIFGNWNRCFELSLSETTVFLHDDDMLCDTYFSSLLPIFNKFEAIDCLMPLQYNLISGSIKNITKDTILKRILINKKKYKYPLFMNYFTGTMGYGSSGCLFRKSKFLLTTGFSLEEYGPIADWGFYIKNYDIMNTYRIHDYQFIYRIDDNFGRNPETIVNELSAGIKIFDELSTSLWYGRLLKPFLFKGQIVWYKNVAKKCLDGCQDKNKYYSELDKIFPIDKCTGYYLFLFIRKITNIMYRVYILVTGRR